MPCSISYTMNQIFLLNETYTNNYNTEILDFISLASIICGVLVIISKNPIISVLFLITLFLSISCYLLVLGLNFIGLSYLLVYVGAVSILFLFILMLINIRVSELTNETSNSIPLAIIIIMGFYSSINNILPYCLVILTINIPFLFNMLDIDYSNGLKYLSFISKLLLNEGDIYFATASLWDGNLAESSHITSIGNIMYTNYSIWLIVTSIILLLAMVGAIVITIIKK